jgi:hypothetical protein
MGVAARAQNFQAIALQRREMRGARTEGALSAGLRQRPAEPGSDAEAPTTAIRMTFS